MYIKKIISQHRRDLTVQYGCEHCTDSHRGYAYDDQNFHQNVVPDMECPACSKTSNGVPFKQCATKYQEGAQV